MKSLWDFSAWLSSCISLAVIGVDILQVFSFDDSIRKVKPVALNVPVKRREREDAGRENTWS
jgi:hypothetical protein